MANTNQSGDDLAGKTRDELEQMAKNIPGVAQSEMSKDELINAIQQHANEGNQNQ